MKKRKKVSELKNGAQVRQAFTLEPRGAKRPTPTSGSLAEITDGSGRESLILKFKNNYWRAQKNPTTFFEISRSGRFKNLNEKDQKSIRIKKRSPGSAGIYA